MNSQLRAALILAPVVAIAGAVLLSTGRDSKPSAKAVREEQPSPGEELQLPAPEPRKLAAPMIEAVTPPPPPSAAVAEPPNEDSMAAAMHALEDSAPERALELARRGQARWPEGPRAAEFAATEVKCLYRLGKPSEGRGAAEAMVNKYPTTTWALEVERQTGAHPYVNH